MPCRQTSPSNCPTFGVPHSKLPPVSLARPEMAWELEMLSLFTYLLRNAKSHAIAAGRQK